MGDQPRQRDKFLTRLTRGIDRRYRDATSTARVLPGFLIIGAARTGSTSLFEYLVAHPQVGPPSHKEIHYFDNNFDRGLGWYRRHFPTLSERERTKRLQGDFRTGEASPYYLFHPLVPERVRRALPNAKLVALLREPGARAYSQYQLERRSEREMLTFEEALEAEPERLEGEEDRIREDPSYQSEAHRHFSYLARGLYADQLESWFGLFPGEQILVLLADDFFADPGGTYRRVLDHLGLARIALPRYETFNYASYSMMKPETRKYLTDYFREPNQHLEELLGVVLDWDV